jgi:hypothetical protein
MGRLRIRGGFLTVAVVVLILATDLWIARCCPQMIPDLWGKPKEHIGDLIAASGVAVAFVLTYLAALTGLPSPGRQLLSSALGHIKLDEPELAAIDEDGRVTNDEFRQLNRFIRDAKDLAPNDPEVQKACDLFDVIVKLAKPPHIREMPAKGKLEELGYSRVRAAFLRSVVFKKDAEKCWLLCATILCSLVFTYSTVVYCLEAAQVMPASIVMPLGYPILALVGMAFSTAMSLRMWPHFVDEALLTPALAPLQQAWSRRVETLTTSDLDDYLDSLGVEDEDQGGEGGAQNPPAERPQ